ncbi:MAG: efflux RND transporter periplasmic adaptor subunit [Sphaerochaetaceae bacterium]|nr:efflux RND transporter periplasmic adaptor subunit [Sphaerochaetaceae bacterium]
MTKIKALVVRWLITLVVVAGLLFLIWKFIIHAEKQTYETPLEPVKTEMAQRGDFEQSINLTGYIEAADMVPVVSFVNGTLETLNVEEGQWVEKDSVIACVDPEPYTLQAQQAEAVYLAAQATYERVKNLFDSNAASRQNLDEAKAQLDAYKAQYDLSMVQLGYTEIKAPVSGTVLSVQSTEGSAVAQGTCVAVLADLNDLEIVLNVPETYYSTIVSNLENVRAEITRSGEEETASARVSIVSPYIDAQSRTFKLTMKIEEGDLLLRPGMFVSVSLVYNRMENVLLLSQKSTTADGSLYMFDPQSSTAKYLGDISLAQGTEYIVIPESYSSVLFITEGQNSVLDGQKVRQI